MRRSVHFVRLGAFLIVVAFAATSAPADVIYVDDDAAGANDGTTWCDAFPELQAALAVARAADEIRVAAGTYHPDYDPASGQHTRDRTATFRLISGVALRGGYAGCATPDPDERDIPRHETILSGDLAGDDASVAEPIDLLDEPTRAENAYHVMTGSGTDATAILDGFTITAGCADGSALPHFAGGGMYNDIASPTLTDCTFSGNTAGAGGGMYNVGVRPTPRPTPPQPALANCTFSGNAAFSRGGGIYNADSSPTLTNCTFSGNSGGGYGGGMYNFYAGSRPALANCTFIENTARSGGGMSNVTNSRPTLTNCTFTANTASGDGGGMSNYDHSRPTLANCTFSGNLAGGHGGGIHCSDGRGTWTACTFTGNAAGIAGGAIYSIGSRSPTLTRCTFSRNVGGRRGGGMYNSSLSSPVLFDCMFDRNSAGEEGGGMYNRWNSNPMLANCMFNGNTARDGGGMYNELSFPALANCTFAGNSAVSRGGAMYHGDSAPTLTNCTLGGNSADVGGGMYNTSNSSPTLASCIVWGDAPNAFEGPGSPAVTYSNIRGGWPGVGNIDADPMFVRDPDAGGDGWGDDPATPGVDEGANDDHGDLRLRPGSPSIDAGDNGAIPADVSDLDEDGDVFEPAPLDLAGNPRRLDDPDTADTGDGTAPIVDIGAYEYVRPGDGDFDYDVDLADYLALLACMTGANAPATAACRRFDLDGDGDVDLADLVSVQAAFTGSR